MSFNLRYTIILLVLKLKLCQLNSDRRLSYHINLEMHHNFKNVNIQIEVNLRIFDAIIVKLSFFFLFPKAFGIKRGYQLLEDLIN